MNDPRGPERTIVAVADLTTDACGTSRPVTLDCSHVRRLNPTFAYRIGDRVRCLACLDTAQAK